MKSNTSINISDPKAAIAFLDAHNKIWFPKKYSPSMKDSAQKQLDELNKRRGNVVRKARLLQIING